VTGLRSTPAAGRTGIERAGRAARGAVRSLDVRSEEEAQRAIDALYAAGTPINVRGAGHLLDLRAPPEGGVRLVNRIRTRLETNAAGEIVASTGWRWAEVVDFAQRRGLTFPVLTSNLDTTVGGTLSAGGFGLFSGRFGMQADHVSACTIHTALGAAGCARSGEALWRAALCSLGTIGFVSSVTLRARPAPERLRLFDRRDEPGAAVEVVLDAAERFADEACLLTCRFENGTATTHVGFEGAAPSPGIAWRERDVSYASLLAGSTIEANPNIRRVWNDYIMPVAASGPFLHLALAMLERADRDERVLRARVRLLAIAQAPATGTSFYVRPGVLAASRTIGVGFYLDVADDDAGGFAFCLELHGLLKAACAAAGGALYNSGEVRLSQGDCNAAFGADWHAFTQARGRYDPAGLFGNGSTLPFAAPPAP